MKHDDVKEDKKLIKSMVKPASIKKGMKKGGVTSKEMKAVGRNMARAMNQRSK
jgi:hypothetical protein